MLKPHNFKLRLAAAGLVVICCTISCHYNVEYSCARGTLPTVGNAALKLAESPELQIDVDAKSLKTLAKAGRVDVLVKIAHSARPDAVEAAVLASDFFHGKEYVAFCQSFPRDSMQWWHLFNGLNWQDKECVLPYVSAVLRECTPKERWACYRVCMRGGWPELIPFAKDDQYSSVEILSSNQFFPETLGTAARRYLAAVEVYTQQ
jgi:hypothetical protein